MSKCPRGMSALLALGLMVGGCTSGGIDAELDLTHGKSNTCEVHGTTMSKLTVPIAYGLYWQDIHDQCRLNASESLFPHAREKLRGGCVISSSSPKRAIVFQCDLCKTAQKQWEHDANLMVSSEANSPEYRFLAELMGASTENLPHHRFLHGHVCAKRYAVQTSKDGLAMMDLAPFRFLEGRPRSRRVVEQRPGFSIYSDYYSFLADFHTVYSQASSELVVLGFREQVRPTKPDDYKYFKSDDTNIMILNGKKASEPERLEKTPAIMFVEYRPAPGWITVIIGHGERDVGIRYW